MGNLKKVEIYITVKMDYKFHIGNYAYYLSYKRAVIKKVGTVKDTVSYQRTALAALYFAIKSMNEPCACTVYTLKDLQFKEPFKSDNKKLMYEVMKLINDKGQEVEFVVTNDFGRVDIWEQVYGHNVSDSRQQDTQAEKKDDSIESNYRDAQPDIANKETPNDVFSTESNQTSESYDKNGLGHSWLDMYNDIDEGSTWVPGSGGY